MQMLLFPQGANPIWLAGCGESWFCGCARLSRWWSRPCSLSECGAVRRRLKIHVLFEMWLFSVRYRFYFASSVLDLSCFIFPCMVLSEGAFLRLACKSKDSEALPWTTPKSLTLFGDEQIFWFRWLLGCIYFYVLERVWGLNILFEVLLSSWARLYFVVWLIGSGSRVLR